MQNYDPNFNVVARPGDIPVSGYNFGIGSSREHTAAAILARDTQLVVTSTFSSTYTRNAINNALMNLQVPRLVERLRAYFKNKEGENSAKSLTRSSGWTLTWDIWRSIVEVQEDSDGTTWTEKVGELLATVQAIIAADGLKAWTKAEINKSKNM